MVERYPHVFELLIIQNKRNNSLDRIEYNNSFYNYSGIIKYNRDNDSYTYSCLNDKPFSWIFYENKRIYFSRIDDSKYKEIKAYFYLIDESLNNNKKFRLNSETKADSKLCELEITEKISPCLDQKEIKESITSSSNRLEMNDGDVTIVNEETHFFLKPIIEPIAISVFLYVIYRKYNAATNKFKYNEENKAS